MTSTADLVTNSVANLTEDNVKKSFSEMDFKEKIAYIRILITIEPLLIFFTLASVVCSTAIDALRNEMACRGNAGYNETVCKIIVAAKHQENGLGKENEIVQQYLTDLEKWTPTVTKIVPLLLLLFVGPFSDRHKIRKPFLLIPIIGEFFAVAFCLLCIAFIGKWTVEIETVCQVIVPSLLGSPDILYTVAFAYIADISEPEIRIVRLAIVTISMNIWSPIGLIISANVYKATGYVVSFLLALLCFISAFVYGLIVVKEPRQSLSTTKDTGSLLKDIINPVHIREMFMFLYKSQKKERFYVLLMFAIVFLFRLKLGDEIPLRYMMQHYYGMSPSDITTYAAAFITISLIGLLVAVPLLSQVLCLSDIIIVVVGLVDSFIVDIIYVEVRSPCGLYMIIIVGMLQPTISTGLSSQMTKYVSENDLGKLLSLVAIVGSIAEMISRNIYVPVYERNRSTRPFVVFYISMLLNVVIIIILGCIYLIEKRELSKPEVNNASELEMKKSNLDTSHPTPQ